MTSDSPGKGALSGPMCCDVSVKICKTLRQRLQGNPSSCPVAPATCLIGLRSVQLLPVRPTSHWQRFSPIRVLVLQTKRTQASILSVPLLKQTITVATLCSFLGTRLAVVSDDVSNLLPLLELAPMEICYRSMAFLVDLACCASPLLVCRPSLAPGYGLPTQ